MKQFFFASLLMLLLPAITQAQINSVPNEKDKPIVEVFYLDDHLNDTIRFNLDAAITEFIETADTVIRVETTVDIDHPNSGMIKANLVRLGRYDLNMDIQRDNATITNPKHQPTVISKGQQISENIQYRVQIPANRPYKNVSPTAAANQQNPAQIQTE